MDTIVYCSTCKQWKVLGEQAEFIDVTEGWHGDEITFACKDCGNEHTSVARLIPNEMFDD